MQMTHPKYGTRTIRPDQYQRYINVGWSPAEGDPTSVAGSAKQVLADVGNDPAAARAALTAEQSRPTPRKTLVTALERIAETPENQEN